MTTAPTPPAPPPAARPAPPPSSVLTPPAAGLRRPTPPAAPPPASAGTASNKTFAVSRGVQIAPQRIGIYGPGGIGKTSLVALLAAVGIEPIIIDLDRGSYGVDVSRIDGVDSFDDLRACLHSDTLFPVGSAVVIDSATVAERLATEWVIANVRHEKKGVTVTAIEDYGYGKGLSHIYDAMVRLMGDLDNLYRHGRHIVLIIHECTSNVPNPAGDDWLRYEPRLQSPASGKNSVRHAVKEWLDHLLFVGYDVATNEDGKATGRGSRAIYPQEMPTHWAKSRKLRQPIVYQENNPELWKQLFA